MPAKIEQIQSAEEQVRTFTTEEQNMRQLYMQDGVIDDTEQEALDRVRTKIDDLETVVTRLRAEFEENRQRWESRSAEVGEAQQQLSDLTAFGHADAATLQAEMAELDSLASQQHYADALTALDQFQVSMGPIWTDYQTQKAAKDEYDPMRVEFDTRLSGARLAEPQTETIVGMITQLETNVAPADTHVEARNYVEALTLQQALMTELEALEAEIMRIQQAQSDYEAELARIQPNLIECSTSEFTALLPQQEALAAKQTEMEQAATAQEYERALELVLELSGMVDAFLPEQQALRDQQAQFEEGVARLQPRITAASSSELSSTAGTQQTIIDLTDQMNAAGEAQDYETGLAHQMALDTALTEYEATLDQRDLYELRLAAMSEELITASSSEARWAYLQPIQAEMATIQTDMETAAAAEDFDTAMSKIAQLEGKLVEFYAAIEAKRAEYETARTALDIRLSDIEACTYPLQAERAAVTAAVATIDAAAGEEDWVAANEAVAAANAHVDNFDAAHDAHHQALIAQIMGDMAPVRATLAAHSSSTSSTKTSLIQLIGLIDQAVASSNDLTETLDDVEVAKEQAGDLEVVDGIMERLAGEWGIFRDDEAREIVNELSPEELAGLPLEARNRLVDEMMSEDMTEEDHDAVQAIWSSPSIDDRFDEFDTDTRERMLEEFQNNPIVQEHADNWATMTDEEKNAAIRDIAAIPCGENGWNMGEVTDVRTEPEHFEGDRSNYRGYFDAEDDALYLNANHPDMVNFTQALMTTTHELGHRYQNQLIERLESGDLSPGAPEYEEARALQQNATYRNEHTDEWKDMVHSRDGSPFYSGTPEETHSRMAANDMREGLNEQFGPSDEQHLPDDHGHTH